MRWWEVSLYVLELFINDFSEQKSCERIAAANHRTYDQAQTDKQDTYYTSEYHLTDKTIISGKKCSDKAHVSVNQD